uniref:Uncharacterized protein n=1 Tax=Oryza brachyantha TaxID=4533 RepID=J3KTX7_ORYBR
MFSVPLYYFYIISSMVTRLKCGGFVTGFYTCHNIADGFGMIQFMKAIADLAHTDKLPIVPPVWEREILMARAPPCVTYLNPAITSLLSNGPDGDDSSKDIMLSTPPEAMVTRVFFFSATDIASLRTHVPLHLAQSTTTFDVLTAAAWRCRTSAIGYQKGERVYLAFTLNARGRCGSGVLPVPRGYFGNALFYAVIDCAVDELCGKPLGHAVELVHNAKIGMASEEEHMRSMVDAMAVQRELPPVVLERTYIVSDTRYLGEDELDFGWAERVGGGIPLPMLAGSIGVSEYTKCKNSDGDYSTAMRMHLPRPAMDYFAKEMDMLLNN